MADFLQALDPSKLVVVGTALSFVASAFHAPPYNLPIFLFGAYAADSSEAIQSIRTFTFLLGGSILYDIIWMTRNEQNWFIRLVTVLTLLLKIPTAFAFMTALQQRGGQFSGLGIRGNDLSGATVWSMPGGFTSSLSGARDGYQTVDDPIEAPKPHMPQPHLAQPQSQQSQSQPYAAPGVQPPPPTQSSAPGAYSAV